MAFVYMFGRVFSMLGRADSMCVKFRYMHNI